MPSFNRTRLSLAHPVQWEGVGETYPRDGKVLRRLTVWLCRHLRNLPVSVVLVVTSVLRKGEVFFKHWAYEVCSVIPSYSKDTIWESTVSSLKGAVVDLVHYLRPHAQMTQIIKKVELVYGTVVSFDILM